MTDRRIRSTSYGQWRAQPHRTPAWRSTSAGRWRGRPGWSHQSRQSTLCYHQHLICAQYDIWSFRSVLLSLWRRNDLDLHCGWGQSCYLPLHPIRVNKKHFVEGISRGQDFKIQISGKAKAVNNLCVLSKKNCTLFKTPFTPVYSTQHSNFTQHNFISTYQLCQDT